MKIHQGFIQNSEQWYALRRGRVTASNFKRIITPARCDYSKQAPSYMRDLLVESFCPDYAKFIGNNWTDRGTEMEPEAREAFRDHTGLAVDEVAFVTAERWKHVVGCSPDGLVKNAKGEYVAGLEIKCPSPFTHAEYIEDGTLPDDYKTQVHGGMVVTGLDEWHFWSYFPNLAPFHIIVKRDDFTAKLEASIDRFVIEYGAYREKMTPRLQVKPAPSLESFIEVLEKAETPLQLLTCKTACDEFNKESTRNAAKEAVNNKAEDLGLVWDGKTAQFVSA